MFLNTTYSDKQEEEEEEEEKALAIAIPPFSFSSSLFQFYTVCQILDTQTEIVYRWLLARLSN